ncbi:unnamed protein product [Calypogeia fissa]
MEKLEKIASDLTTKTHSEHSADSSEPQEVPVYEVAIVCILPKPLDIKSNQENVQETTAIEYLKKELEGAGLLVEVADGVLSEVFLKIGAPLEVIGRTAEREQLKKPTDLGLEVVFEWERKESFLQQRVDSALFSWTERYHCLHIILKKMKCTAEHSLKFQKPDGKGEFEIKPGDLVLPKLKEAGVVAEVFPLHDEKRRKRLLDVWAYNWHGFWIQPIDEIYSYFGGKVAIYFAFLGMYTKWLLFPGAFGLLLWFKDFGSWEPAIPPIFSMTVIIWSVLFLQFWKRHNAGLQARWGMVIEDPEVRESRAKMTGEDGSVHVLSDLNEDESRSLENEEWKSRLKSLRNNAIVFVGIVCVQMPFELLYAHLNKIAGYDVLRYGLTAVYILVIQNATKFGGQVALNMVKSQKYKSREEEANDLIYKVFGIYFMQSYIGLFYHALFHRDFIMLRHLLIQRLIVSQLMNNVTENLLPYLSYRYARYKAFKEDQELKKAAGEKIVDQHASKIEKEKLKPTYCSSIPSDLEDGLFDDYLELALQFGMVTMFACALPLVATFAFINNLMEIRSDSFKLLGLMRRPVPRASSSVGAWLKIFQDLGVVAIVTNCALLVCLYDEVGRWSVEPGLVAILVLEHVLVLTKVGFSWFVPEEPAWVKAKRMRRVQMQSLVSRQLLALLEKTRNSQ